MKAVVDKGGCISCGVCVDTCPEVFQFDGDGVAEAIVDAVPAELEGAVEESRDACPVSVISIEN